MSEEQYAWPIVLLKGLICLATIFGNFMVFLIIFRDGLSCKTFRFLMSLSMADFLMAPMVMLPSIISRGYWTWGPGFCKFHVTSDILLCSASIYNLLGISIDRLRAVWRPFSYSQESTWTTNVIIISAWVLATTIALPIHIDHPGFSSLPVVLPNMTKDGDCRPPDNPDSSGYNLYSTIMAIILPCTLMIIFNIAIIIKMQVREEKRLQRSKSFLKKNESQRAITKMMLVTVGVFILCYLPFAVAFTAAPYCKEIATFLETHPFLVDVFTWLTWTNSCLNPIIYALMNRRIRREMMKLVKCQGWTLTRTGKLVHSSTLRTKALHRVSESDANTHTQSD